MYCPGTLEVSLPGVPWHSGSIATWRSLALCNLLASLLSATTTSVRQHELCEGGSYCRGQ